MRYSVYFPFLRLYFLFSALFLSGCAYPDTFLEPPSLRQPRGSKTAEHSYLSPQ